MLDLQDKLNKTDTFSNEEILLFKNQLNDFKIEILLDKIYNYSNKFSYIIDKLIKTQNKSYSDNNDYFPTGKVLIYSDFRESISGGVNFFDKLLSISDLGFKSFSSILDKSLIDKIFISKEEKNQYKDIYFSPELKQKLIDNYLLKLNETPEYKNNIYYLWQTSSNKNQKIIILHI